MHTRHLVLARRLTARLTLIAASTVVPLTLPLATASAQTVGFGGPQRATRADLTALQKTFEQRVAATRDGNARLKLQLDLAAIRDRLTQGDFRPGDRFVVTLARDSAPSVDTVLVRDSLLVLVGGLPEVRLAAVLRSELDTYLQSHVSRYLKNVTVRSSVLTRVLISGPVTRPGFYYASPDQPVSDLLMLAGGPGTGANLNSLRVRRGTVEFISAKQGRRVIKDGRTLEQLDIQSGDEVVVGSERRRLNWGLVIQIASVVSFLLFATLQFIQWYVGLQDNR